jgi:TP901 family phage tail tape measure protein
MATNILNIDIIPKLQTSAVTDVQKRLKSILGNETDVEIDIDVDDKKVKDSFKDLPDDAKKAGDDSGKKFGSSFASGAKKLIAGAAILGGLTAAFSAVKSASEDFINLEQNVRNISTLGVNVDGLLGKLSESGKQLPLELNGIAEGYYNAISGGVTGTQEQVIDFVEVVGKTAVGGLAEVADATNTFTNVMNSYNVGAEAAENISNGLFASVQFGSQTFNELSSALPAVTSDAASLGVEFNEVSGIMAQLSKTTESSSVASTKFKALLIELQKPTGELKKFYAELGLSAQDVQEKIKEQGLANTLNELEQAASGSGKQFNLLFGSAEAGSAALKLTGENAEVTAKTLRDVNQAIEDGAATTAYEKNLGSLQNQLKLAKNNIQATFNTAFTAVLPVVNQLLTDITPILSGLLDGIAPVLSGLGETLTPILKNVFDLITPIIDIIANQLAPTIFNLIGIIAQLFEPIGAIITPIINALSSVLAEVLPVIEELVEVLVAELSEALLQIAPLIEVLAEALGSVLADVLKLVAKILTQVVSNAGGLINALLGLLQILTPVIELVLKLATTIISVGVTAFSALIDVVGNVVGLISDLVTELVGVVTAIGEFFGIIEKKVPEAPFKKTADDAEVATTKVQDLNKELEKKEPIDNNNKLNESLKDTSKKTKDNTKYVVEYFKAFKEGQDDLLRMAKIEDEITRIREERSKNINDEIVEQERNIDSLLERKLKLEQSLADGFVIKEDGSKIKIKADERVDLQEMLSNLNSDLQFESANLRKLQITAEIDEKKLKEETEATVAKLQRERLELEVDMDIRPKTDLLDAYRQDLLELDVAITGAGTIEQEKLQNERLKKLKQIHEIEKELNRTAAEKAAEEYSRSFNAVVDSFRDSLDTAFESVSPNTERIDAINAEIEALEDKRIKTLNDYKEGIISAKEYNDRISEIEEDRVNKVKELNNSQFNSFKILADGLAKAFTTVSDQYAEMAKTNIQTIKKLSKQEEEYQELQSKGVEIPEALQKAHEEYGQAATDAYNQLGVSAGSTLAALLVQGELTAKSFLGLALDTMNQVMTIYIAEIVAISSAQLGPIAGPIAAAVAIAGVQGLIAIAKSKVGGASRGVFELNESNMGSPGHGDDIPMMVRRRETIIPPEITDANPVIAAIMRDRMTEEQYYNNVYLPKKLAGFKIDMPSLGMAVMPAELNEKALKQLRESAKKVEMLNSRFDKIDHERLSVAISRMKQDNRENTLQTKMLSEISNKLSEGNEKLSKDVRQLRSDFDHKTTVNLEGKFKFEDGSLQAVLKQRERRLVT